MAYGIRNTGFFLCATITLFCASGCVPFAWLTPPTKLEATLGAVVEIPPDSDDDDSAFEFSAPLRAGLYPLQLVRSLDRRMIDAGVGYQVWVGPQERFPHGPFLDLTYLHPFPQRPLIRGFATFKAHALRRTISGWGFGGSLQGGVEFLDFVDGPFESCDGDGCAFGQGYGEAGFGVYFEMSRVFYEDADLTYAGLGVSFRIPATFGVGFAWLDL